MNSYRKRHYPNINRVKLDTVILNKYKFFGWAKTFLFRLCHDLGHSLPVRTVTVPHLQPKRDRCTNLHAVVYDIPCLHEEIKLALKLTNMSISLLWQFAACSLCSFNGEQRCRKRQHPPSRGLD